MTESRFQRRRFLAAAAAGAGLSASSPKGEASEPSPLSDSVPVLKLASREFVIPGDTLPEKLDRMEEWGFSGIELDGARLPERIVEIRNALRGRPLEVGAVCSGYEGVLIHEDPDIRWKTVDNIKEIISHAAEFMPTGMIIVPAFNGQTQLQFVPAREALMSVLPALGEHAHKCGTRVLIEPLNRNEAWYYRTLSDAAAICKEIGHPGVAMMGDFFHMGIEEASDYGAFITARDFLFNVHLGSRQRYLPGQDDRDFRPGFKALKEIGYRKFCSLECFPIGDPLVEIPKSVKFIRTQWREA